MKLKSLKIHATSRLLPCAHREPFLDLIGPLSQVRADLASLEQERARQRLENAAAFLDDNRRHTTVMQAAASSALKNVQTTRTESERAVLDLTAPFWYPPPPLFLLKEKGRQW